MEPLISVIIPVFNQDRFIGRCIRSLNHQLMHISSYEIIVIDDGSTDNTKYALSQFIDPNSDLMTLITLPENRGLPAALNCGIRASKAKYIVRVDSDDFVNVHFLAFLSYYLETNNNVAAVSCDYLVVDDKEEVIRRASAVNEPIACGIMFRRDALLQIGLYDEELRSHEDKDLKIRLEKSFEVKNLPLPLYRYRRHETNMTNNKPAMQEYLEILNTKHGITE